MGSFTQQSRESRSRTTSDGYSRADGTNKPLQQRNSTPQETAQDVLQEKLNQSPHVQSQIQLQQMLNASPRVVAQAKLAEAMNSRDGLLQRQRPIQYQQLVEDEGVLERQTSLEGAPTQLRAATDEEESLPEKLEPVRKQENRTGLPDNLKAGVENLSGLSMDDVKVHYNSSAPATVQAVAYTQGTNIHVAPGQEKHLAHEAWHVAQQKQGRVRPTIQTKGIAVNDDRSLEKEADRRGEEALQMSRAYTEMMKVSSQSEPGRSAPEQSSLQLLQTKSATSLSSVIQMGNQGSKITEQDISKFDALYLDTFGELPKEGAEIPKTIHRFWAGGKMSDDTMANLKKMEDAVNETPWEHILWTSKAVNEAVNNPKLFEQIEELKGAGVLVSDISELPKQLENVPNFDEALNTRVQAAIQDLVSGKPNYMDVKFLSDMVRLAATYQQGGVYMDTDIAPGKVDFSKTTLHHRDEEGEVPLAGVQVQNTQAFAKATQGPKTPEENLFANTKNIGQPVFNFFYATQKGTESNRAALDTMIKYPKATGMEAAVKHFANATNPAEWMVPWLTDLGWTTEASDMQEGEQREKEEGKEGKK